MGERRELFGRPDLLEILGRLRTGRLIVHSESV
jgi:hypothetical protein